MDFGLAARINPINAVAVSTSDTVNLPGINNAVGAFIVVGGSGNVVVDTVGGQTAVVFNNVPAGGVVGQGLRVVRVRTTNTTATNMVFVY